MISPAAIASLAFFLGAAAAAADLQEWKDNFEAMEGVVPDRFDAKIFWFRLY